MTSKSKSDCALFKIKEILKIKQKAFVLLSIKRRVFSFWGTPGIVDSMEAPSKAFLLFFPLPDWLKLNHLKSRMECGFQTFLRHFCSTVAETIGLTNYTASFGAKNVQKTTFKAAEMILGPWNQHT